jgi:uncharacterized membrane protein HdeD (DUF308 family)
MDVQDNRRFEIARRNQRRALEAREYKLMMIMFGIVGYSAVTNLMVGVLNMFAANVSVAIAIAAIVLGALYALATYQAWFKSKPSWWLIALPAVISILMSVVAIFMGKFGYVSLLLNVALIALIPLRASVQKSLAMMSQTDSSP